MFIPGAKHGIIWLGHATICLDQEKKLVCLFPVTDKLRDLFFQIKTVNNDTCSSVVTLTSVEAVDCHSKKKSIWKTV